MHIRSEHWDLGGASEAPGPGAAWIIVTVSHNIMQNIIISDINTSGNVSFIPQTNIKYEYYGLQHWTVGVQEYELL